jgi:hypothetical protein
LKLKEIRDEEMRRLRRIISPSPDSVGISLG